MEGINIWISKKESISIKANKGNDKTKSVVNQKLTLCLWPRKENCILRLRDKLIWGLYWNNGKVLIWKYPMGFSTRRINKIPSFPCSMWLDVFKTRLSYNTLQFLTESNIAILNQMCGQRFGTKYDSSDLLVCLKN